MNGFSFFVINPVVVVLIGTLLLIKVRGALVGSVFRKMLQMDTASSTYSSGELTNLMSVDTQGVLEYSCYTHFIWATSLQVSFVLSGGKARLIRLLFTGSFDSTTHFSPAYIFAVAAFRYQK